MGLLNVGSPLTWPETKKEADTLKKYGIEQFIEMYSHLKHKTSKMLRWGDEIEYMVIAFDHEKKKAQLSLVASQLLPKLSLLNSSNGCCPTRWVYEFAEYMVEATPGSPYRNAVTDIENVECNMRKRRCILQKHLRENEYAACITTFPRTGCPNFTTPEYQIDPDDENALSLFFPNQAIAQGHPRFLTLASNIKARRGEKVRIDVPIFKDVNTPSPFVDWTVPEGKDKPLEDHIYMDSMGFGMGCSCLQVTFQAANVDEARILYDQLCPLTPILLALSAASPVWKGFLSDVDCRWDVIAASVDDRTADERDPNRTGGFYIPQSRYGCMDCYLSEEGKHFNDIPVVKDEEFYKHLIDKGVDHLLAQHIAHLFIRDPLVAFSERLGQMPNDSFHFETIQSTNWNNMRFKVPPPDATEEIGWRVEFRPCELQFTEYENAAFVIFVILLTRAILQFPISFLVPVSVVQKNMKIAQERDAVLKNKFAFRIDVGSCNGPCKCPKGKKPPVRYGNRCYIIDELTIDEIINGSPEGFIGLIPLIRGYLSKADVDAATTCRIGCYLHLISCRASGRMLTNARWIRNFIQNHPEYKGDSVVGERINYDLLMRIRRITEDQYGEDVIRRVLHEFT